MNKILTTLLLTLIAIGVIAIFIKFDSNKTEPTETTTAGEEVSFICEGGENFVVEFASDFKSAKTFVAGELKHTLEDASTPEIPYRFYNKEVLITFAGEEATVVNLGTTNSYTCNQPFDPNNAPYNFGDSAEGAGTQQDPVTAINENVLGVWQSTDDEKSVREFHTNNVLIEKYDGEVLSQDIWTFFNGNSGTETPFPQDDGLVYLQLSSASTTEPLYFQLASLTPEKLELVYLNRGGILTYSYVGPITE